MCDKGGECPLQDFSYTFGPDQSRMEFPRRVFDGDGVKGDVDFGPTLMLNRQRCILCTRCVRFMRDIDGDAQINIIDRGYGSEIATFQEEGVHSLISGNLMDVCPVGAITTRDYRFKSRPWDNPNAADTICTQCEKGCNITVWLKAKPEWAKGARLVRVTPRFNPDVNGYWMCDIGRFNYHWIEGDDRLRRPLQRDANGVSQPVSWHDAIARLSDRLAAPAFRSQTACGSCSRHMRRTKSSFCSAASPKNGSKRAEAGPREQRPERDRRRLAVSTEKPARGHAVQGAAGRRAERQRRAPVRSGAGQGRRRRAGSRSLGAQEGRRSRNGVGALCVRPGTGWLAGAGRLDRRRAKARDAAAARSSRVSC